MEFVWHDLWLCYSLTTDIKVLFFASAREAAGTQEVQLTLHHGDDTSALRTQLAETYPKLAQFVLDDDSITLAVNEEYVPHGESVALKSGDTVALIPPISGG